MSKYSGYMDRVVMLDLSTQEVRDYPWSDEERELYIGGRAMASKILSDCLTGREKALSEENLIVITTGPLTGTGAPCSNHFNISALSPVTGSASYASCGGDFGLYLKKAGIDALIIAGKCQEPTWIEISSGGVAFKRAGGIWGLNTDETQAELQSLMDKKRRCRVKCGMLAIGPAGEHLVNYATVVSCEREAEHCDIGAVFGYKNLKALVATGNREIPVADIESSRANNMTWSAILRRHPLTGELLPKMGTAGFVKYLNEQGMLPTKNYAEGVFADAESLGGELFADRYNVACRSCTYCPIRCERSAMLDGKLVRGPELEVMALMGSNILNSDPSQTIRWNNEMFKLGLDAVSTANTLAWAMEANEAGVFKSTLEFGRTSKISNSLEDIAYRRGIGTELAEGSILLEKKYGGEFSYSMKPLELVAVDSFMGIGTNKKGESTRKALTEFADSLQEAVSSSGQCRMTNFADIPACVFAKPHGAAAAAVRAVLPLSEPVFRLLSLLPEELTAPLPHFVHTKALKYALDMKMSFTKYIDAGRRGLETEAALREKFGVKAVKSALPETIATSHKAAAKKASGERVKAKIDKLRSIDSDSVPIVKLLKREA